MEVKWYYKLIFAFLRALAHLPLGVLYAISDVLIFPLVFYVVRYRRPLVRRQLAESLPELSEAERTRVERDFYHFFADYIVETLKLLHITPEEMLRRVEWVGFDALQHRMDREGKQFAMVYLGHLGNWEWMTSFTMHLLGDNRGGQVYHPLYDKAVDQLFIDMRRQFGGECIPMKETLRYILRMRQAGTKAVIGMIADQSPKWEAMHQWCEFLHHKTSFFIGTEAIARKVDAVVAYADVSRPRRGYYRVEFSVMTTEAPSLAEHELTNRYAELLEQTIRRAPHLWLWTHNRWKRSYEEWLQRQGKV